MPVRADVRRYALAAVDLNELQWSTDHAAEQVRAFASSFLADCDSSDTDSVLRDSLCDHCRCGLSETSTTDILLRTRLCTAPIPTAVTPFQHFLAKADA